ncbi:MAG: hypothetical protein IPM63_10545 [Acidobacteriota bacterium]|nr:MAG: hypothetical protein IPM63_10545 [Acidobacteriota bacterium]
MKKFLTAIGLSAVAAGSVSAQNLNGPYEDPAANAIYQLLFCDRLSLFKDDFEGDLVEPWKTLFAEDASSNDLAKIAADTKLESRQRALAYGLLRKRGKEVPKGVILGTIVEVHLPEGLDTLAVFTDGSVRYINHTGKMVFVEGKGHSFEAEAKDVIEASQTVVDAIGPWDKDRLAAPIKGNIRMSFLVSDGLYFGEGTIETIYADNLSGPMIKAAEVLLLKLIEQSVGKRSE